MSDRPDAQTPSERVRRRRFHSPESRGRSQVRMAILIGLFAVVVLGILVVANGVYRARRAAADGLAGKQALLQAEDDIGKRNLDEARRHIRQAEDAFARMKGEIRALGPLLPVARITPFVRVQVRGAEAFAAAGEKLASGGDRLIDAAAGILTPADQRVTVAEGIDALVAVEAALRDGLATIDGAIADVAALDGYRLVGSLSQARQELAARLPAVRARAASAEAGLAALVEFIGGNGPRRYLVFAQNPDEVRPTGGYIGTYGVLVAEARRLRVERFAGIETWYQSRPQAALPPDAAPTALQLASPPERQTIANANATADFAAGAQLAADLWARGGEQPVDGVLALTPDLMVRIVSVLGPVDLPAFGETITAANLLERIDYYTHRDPNRTGATRKDIVGELAQAVVGRLLSAPASSWEKLAQAVADGFAAREAMAWSSHPAVQDDLRRRGWDGSLGAAAGDFFCDAEFEYEAKNGRGLRRTFTHQVALRDDGSALVTTTITIANTEVTDTYSSYNLDSASYLTLYGPAGATIREGSDDPEAAEAAVDGHPGWGFLRSAPPLGETQLQVVWEAPGVAVRRADGTLAYRLRFLGVVAHTGDVLNLDVTPPPGWSWAKDPPPAKVSLDRALSGEWALTKAK